MQRYYFDIRDGEKLTPDEEGIEFATLRAVQEEAARSLVDLVRNAIWEGADDAWHLSIEVRDEKGPVLQVRFGYELGRIGN